MAPARSLHEILAGLTGGAGASGDLAAVLHAGGHPDLPPDLVAEAVVSYAGTAPVEVAEHLATFVMAYSPMAEHHIAAGDIGQLPDLLASAPVVAPGEDVHLAVPEIDPPVDHHGAGTADLPDGTGHPFGDTAAGSEAGQLDTAFGRGDGLALPAPADAGTADPEVAAAGFEEAGSPAPNDPDAPDGEPPLDADLWVTPTPPGDAPEIDDIDAAETGWDETG